MGDCDRMKKHISDYLDQSLDPTTKQEYEQSLKNSAELGSLTRNVEQVRTLLGSLETRHCSDDFNVRLRERILHSQEQTVRDPFKRYALSISFAAIFVLVIVFIYPFSAEEETDRPGSSNPAVQTPAATINPGVPAVDRKLDGGGVQAARDIKTLDEAKVASDSSKDMTDPNLKHVDKKDIQQVRP